MMMMIMIMMIIISSEIAGFRSSVDTMLRKVTEISTQVGEMNRKIYIHYYFIFNINIIIMNRNRENNLLIHGLPTQARKVVVGRLFYKETLSQIGQ